MSASFYDLQKYAATGLASPDMTHYDKMRALSLSGGKIKTMTGVPPLTFKSNGKPLISLSMLGNAQQTSTPSPQSIVIPDFCGKRTANLFDAATAYGSMYDSATGVLVGAASTLTFLRNKFASSMVGVPVTISIRAHDVSVTRVYIRCTIGGSNVDSNNIGTGKTGTMTVTVTPTSVNDDWRVTYGTGSGDITLSNIMLNAGNTALQYEPYGWKVPITCGGTTTPIYTAEQETTRQIRKIAFNGTETGWQLFTVSGVHQFYIDNALTSAAAVSGSSAVSNIASYGATAANRASYQYGCYAVSSGNGIAFQMVGSEADFPDVAAWKQYLTNMASAGTPVTAWYILAAEQTGIVNEPLCKIGAYADELHITNEVTIPTVKGSNTLTVDTDLPPSEMTITYTK